MGHNGRRVTKVYSKGPGCGGSDEVNAEVNLILATRRRE